MAKIALIYGAFSEQFLAAEMSHIRWLKMAEALARLGHSVDMISISRVRPQTVSPGVNLIAYEQSKLSSYDVIKALYHSSYEYLSSAQAVGHPGLIARLGSVVGSEDSEGVHFYGKRRQYLFEIQKRIHEQSPYISLLGSEAKQLWIRIHGKRDGFLLVPGGVESRVPKVSEDPFPPQDEKLRCLFAGNVYTAEHYPEANATLLRKLNRLGQVLSRKGITLYMIGHGDVSGLDQAFVKYLGEVEYQKTWNYLYHAQVGISLTPAGAMNNHESTKIYHYLRAGLPVVTEDGFVNAGLVEQAGLGFVAPTGNTEALANAVSAAATRDWNKDYAVNYILANHTWDKRALVYDDFFRVFHHRGY